METRDGRKLQGQTERWKGKNLARLPPLQVSLAATALPAYE